MGEKKLIGVTKSRKREGKLSMSEQLFIVIFMILRDLKIYNNESKDLFKTKSSTGSN